MFEGPNLYQMELTSLFELAATSVSMVLFSL